MDESEFRALVSPDGSAALAEATARPVHDAADIARSAAALRARGFTPEVVAAALTQSRLRARASAKFGDFADQMFFTENGLQQATRLGIAALHAHRYQRAGVAHVADLGCGIGADSLAFASLDMAVTAVEHDPVTAAIAAYNLAPFPHVNVVNDDAREADISAADGVFADPARRSSSGGATRRTTNPDDFTPPLDWLYTLADDRALGLKLGPGHPHDAIPEGCEAQWVSDGGSAVELGLWFGRLARPGRRFTALVLGRGAPAEIEGEEDAAPVDVGPLSRWIYDPDPAVIRARALGTLAAQLGATAISPKIAYLTSEAEADTPFAQRFEVIDDLPFDRKRLRGIIRDRGIGTLEIKKRGADIDPAALRKELRPAGDAEATLFVTRVAGRHRAILARRP